MHADGYVELRDRLKDVIISGGENIATIEVEQALERPRLGRPRPRSSPRRDERWGEVPVAFVTAAGSARRPTRRSCRSSPASGSRASRSRSASIVVDELPKTGTGKIQKFVLREQAQEDAEKSGK